MTTDLRPPVLPRPTADRDGAAEAATWELQLRRYAVPGALLFAFLVTGPNAGRAIARFVSGMWLHELGHASAAWACGYSAVPLPWFTSISATRSLVVTALLLGGFGYLAFRAHRAERRRMTALFGALAALALVGRLLPASAAQTLITFWGDGGAMLYGALLVCTFYAPPGSRLHRGAVRWGLLVLGALAFADVFRTWWAASADMAEIPFGRIEGVGLSDPSKLVDVAGWTERGMIHAYLALGGLCLAALAALWALWLRPPEAVTGPE